MARLKFLMCGIAITVPLLFAAAPASAAPTTGRTCYDAIATNWPASSQSWARAIVWRESNNTPSAANARSTARGCFQLMMSIHAKRFYAVGCTPQQWSDPDCNVKAALTLFKSSGTAPWRLGPVRRSAHSSRYRRH